MPRAGRRPTLADVAAHAGLSPGTASLALRGAAGPSAASVARVRAAADALGYRADRAASVLARRRTHQLGLALTVTNAFHAELAEGLQEEAEDAGYSLLLGPVTRRGGERAAVDALLDSRCEALLLLGPDAADAELSALGRRLPLVVIGRRVEGVDAVRAPEGLGIALAVDHLVALGHRDLVHVSGDGAIGAARREGFATATAAAGVGERARVLEGAFSEAAGVAAGRRLLAEGLGRSTAVVAANDRVALGLLDVLARAGVDVPGRMSVVGYDDSALADLAHVRLTSVGQDPRGQARAAVRAAVERLDGGRTEAVDVALSPHLVTRATTAPP